MEIRIISGRLILAVLLIGALRAGPDGRGATSALGAEEVRGSARGVSAAVKGERGVLPLQRPSRADAVAMMLEM